MSAAEQAAARFGREFAAVRWVHRPGGFSGAGVYAGFVSGLASPVFCIKSYPPDSRIPERLDWIHAQIRRAADLGFVPRLFPAQSGGTIVRCGGRIWELTEWKPGTADFRDRPTAARLANACRAVAELHREWQPVEPTIAPFPGFARRLALLRVWTAGVPTAPGPEAGGSPAVREVVARARSVLPKWVAWAVRELAAWAGRPVPVHPCLCDIHHDHVLFTGDVVTGVIDYAAMKVDHPAVDLARLLGDLVPDDPDRTAAGLAAYRAAGGSAHVTAELVELLDRTGTVCAAANWLMRLNRSAPAGAAERLERIVRRLEREFADRPAAVETATLANPKQSCAQSLNADT
jgi:aminoglycoside phosphotransferase (APT) family kinase protein